MCRVKVTAGIPRRWPRQFRSTMIPSTPCTSPELASTSASPPADSLSVFLSLICQSLSLSVSFFLSLSLYSHLSLSPCSLSLSLHTHSTHSLNLHQSGSRRGKSATSSRFFVKGTISNQRSQSSRLSNQQSSTAKPEGFRCAKEKQKQTIYAYYKLSHYFEFVFSI